MTHHRPTIADLDRFDEIIDVRSPAEFADDHLPGAISCPVLDDAQRAEVGTLYKQVSPFEAKKLGAAMVSENIARHLRERFRDRPKHWKPLIYCWRGGERSGAMTTVFRAIGWPAGQLDGGYKAWRGHVVAQLADLPGRFRFRVLCGPTGCGKTRILQAIAAAGGQVVDLETLAGHKGSVLGVLPGQPQPAQKGFESALFQSLGAFDPQRPVYVEAESRKIGRLHLPDALLAAMHAAPCIEIEVPPAGRVDFLLRDYAYFPRDPVFLRSRLERLRPLVARSTMADWLSLVDQEAWPALVEALLAGHYDPLYRRSQLGHFAAGTLARISTVDLSENSITALAGQILAS